MDDAFLILLVDDLTRLYERFLHIHSSLGGGLQKQQSMFIGVCLAFFSADSPLVLQITCAHVTKTQNKSDNGA